MQVPELCARDPKLLFKLCTMVAPAVLVRGGVRVNRECTHMCLEPRKIALTCMAHMHHIRTCLVYIHNAIGAIFLEVCAHKHA